MTLYLYSIYWWCYSANICPALCFVPIAVTQCYEHYTYISNILFSYSNASQLSDSYNKTAVWQPFSTKALLSGVYLCFKRNRGNCTYWINFEIKCMMITSKQNWIEIWNISKKEQADVKFPIWNKCNGKVFFIFFLFDQLFEITITSDIYTHHFMIKFGKACSMKSFCMLPKVWDGGGGG